MKQPEITTAQMLRECQRELSTRKGVYPRWIGQQKITQKLADERIAVMEAMVSHFQGIENLKKQPTLF